MAESLGAPVRIEMLRMLIRAGQAGLSVGELQERLAIPRSTVSHHLQKLIHAELLYQQRVGTTLYCHPNFAAMQDLLVFLTAECCTKA
ncbi:MAG: metalloregulator ArsR/SmtB family transcription factor [Caldilineaceae bacterium]